MERIIKEHYREYEDEQKYVEKFKQEKMYVDIMENLKNNNSDSQEWTKDYEMIFGMLYGTAQEMFNFCEDVTIKYGDIYICLFEMHGQGCFQSISINKKDDLDKEGLIVIDYEDLLKFYETGELALKYKSLKALERALEILDRAHGSQIVYIEGIKIDLKEAHSFIIKELSCTFTN